MNALKPLFRGSCILALVLMLAPVAWVNERDQQVVGTFSAPVMIPGKILPAGTYVFKVIDDRWLDKEVVRVMTADEKPLAIAFTVARYRPVVDDKDIFQLEERSAGSPQAIKSWFYPGRHNGHEFLYPAAATVSSAMNSNAGSTSSTAPTPSAAPSSPAESAAVTPEQPTAAASAPVVANNMPTEAQTQTQPQNQTQAQSQPPQASTSSAQAELPKTASSTPLIGLLGIVLLGGALGLKALTAVRS